MQIITTLKALVATISAMILTVLGLSTPAIAPELPLETPIAEIATTTAKTPEITQETPKSEEKTALQDAYEIGKSVGYIQAKLEQIEQLNQLEKQIEESKPATTTPVANPIPEPIPVPTAPSPIPTPAPLPTPQPQIEPQPKNMSSLEIISPMSNKGLGRIYRASPQVVDESNYIVIGLVVTNENGEIAKDVVVTVESTDTAQNKTINGTGNVAKIYKNGNPKEAHYYPYNYEFKTSGKHTITFKALGLTESVELDVLEATETQ